MAVKAFFDYKKAKDVKNKKIKEKRLIIYIARKCDIC